MSVSAKMILSAGIIVVRKEQEGWKYLFLRAFRNWDFPKGEIQAGESPRETAVRETREETGITELRFHWGEVFKETEPYKRGTKIARYYLAQTSADQVVFAVNPEIGGPEHHEYRWLSGSELERLTPARLLPVIRWARGIVEE
jgi:8-oxo-dGTP pyrophosphatase MutT (NUDIX family)